MIYSTKAPDDEHRSVYLPWRGIRARVPAYSHLQNFCRRKGEGQNGDVVVLAELLRSLGNLPGRLSADLARPIESKEFARRGSRFNNSVREESELIARHHVERLRAILGLPDDAQRK